MPCFAQMCGLTLVHSFILVYPFSISTTVLGSIRNQSLIRLEHSYLEWVTASEATSECTWVKLISLSLPRDCGYFLQIDSWKTDIKVQDNKLSLCYFLK